MSQRVIGILYGGKTGEHEVSCRSAASVVAKLDRANYRPLLIGIDKKGVWYLQDKPHFAGSGDVNFLKIERSPESLVSVVPGQGLALGTKPLPVDLIFPVLHGSFGEDGTIQGLLEIAHLPYAGAGVLGSALGMDKVLMKRIWERAGLPVVPFMELSKTEIRSRGFALADFAASARKKFGLPLFVKPVCAGSSVGVSRVDTLEEFAAAVSEALRFDTRVMIEPSVVGREIECSVVGNHEPQAFVPGEIVSRHAFYDYDAKYIDPDGAELVIPAAVSPQKQEEVRRVALEAYRAGGIDGMARVDFFVEEQTGAVLLNELNTIPGFTNISMFSRMCEAAGLGYSELLTRLIELGIERFDEREKIEYSITSD